MKSRAEMASWTNYIDPRSSSALPTSALPCKASVSGLLSLSMRNSPTIIIGLKTRWL